ncbi:uncharacterized protein BYT42DRAFT_267260 [Radiomyces spectabilis]|uniref:uncharacterized protein n=1 Tax=Radiomyces spectabilis TaxID=64574 RepID=UPI00221F362F|nr:uncharacterized protein BYT42DRAFT_267260 [Radiomyces spectabilis]KAI8384596.1 hypothetical protein BYT42DRAFT_267260 [Radiomyces spectabilis]
MPNTAFRRFARRSSVKDTFDLLSGMHDDSHDADSHVFQDPIIPRRRRPLAQPVKVTYLQAKREKRKRTLEEQRAASDSSSEQEGSDKNRKDDDDDDDFQSSSRLRRHRTSANATPSKRSKRSTRAKNETIASPPSPVPKLNLPRKSARMSTSLAEKQEQKKELERKREALEKTGFSSKQATHANGRNQGTFIKPNSCISTKSRIYRVAMWEERDVVKTYRFFLCQC